ncbi:protein of unknown function [Raineyella antarctica]|uniref:DUF4192 domain-containing protein n=1 Tax=Raineyella antarctica TaxID=1577474 RepID=A0A1G6GXY9_9ACTN|nr:DUF4192 domain-containing protein [Raineyella antarctica]SDB86897.1 protein of unknown function [Raineyella antarctica]
MDQHSLAAGEPEQLTISTHGLQGILATVPYLLGFHPQQSLVTVLFEGPRVLVTLRLDISRLVDDPEGVEQFVREQLERTEATAVLLVAYTEVPDPIVGERLEGLSIAIEADGLVRDTAPDVMDAVHVAAGRYRSVTCRDTTCCPPEGFDYEAVLSDPAAAQAVVGGLPALADREDLRAAILPGSDDPGEEYDDTLLAMLLWLRGRPPLEVAMEMDARLRQVEAGGRVPQPRDLAILTALATDPHARDVATLRIHRLSAPLWADVWAAAARNTDDLAAVAPLCLVGVAAWARGDGALVCLCLEEAERRCPEHGLVRLLDGVVELGLHPDEWHRMRRESLDDFGPLGPASQLGQEDEEEQSVG